MKDDTRKGTGVRVAKLGGSLLNLADFPSRLRRCLSDANRRNPLPTMLVVGGGGLIDAVRELDALHRFEGRKVHHECIGLLSVTARLTRQLLPELDYLAGGEAIGRFVKEPATIPNRCAVVDVGHAMPMISAQVGLPEDWATTSDSLSAALAIATNAEELLIFKSADPPIDQDRQSSSTGSWLNALASAGFIDAALPGLADRLPSIRFVNLRGS